MTREQYLKSKIVENGWKLKDFAKEIDMPYTTLLSIVNSSVGGASLDNVTKICNGLNIDIENLNPQKRKNLELNTLETTLVKEFRKLNDEGKKYIMLTMTMAKEKFSAESDEKEDKEYTYGNIAAFGGGTKKIKYTKKEAKEAVEAIDQFHYLSMTEDDEE